MRVYDVRLKVLALTSRKFKDNLGFGGARTFEKNQPTEDQEINLNLKNLLKISNLKWKH